MKSLLKPVLATLALALLPAASMCPPTPGEREVCEHICELIEKESAGVVECPLRREECEKALASERARLGAAAYSQAMRCAIQASSLEQLGKCDDEAPRTAEARRAAGGGDDGGASGQAREAGVFSPLLRSFRAPANLPVAAPRSAGPAATDSPAASPVVASPSGADPAATDPSAASPAATDPPARPLPSRRPEIPLAKPGAP